MPSQLRSLQNEDRVAVVGGGPAGSFFAIHLLRQAKRLGRNIEVVIVEKRGPTEPSADDFQCRGCNFCAGLISPRLNKILEEHGLVVPEEIIQGRIDYVWIQGQWKNLRLRVPKDMQMYSVFRGSLPGRRSGRPAGFDGFREITRRAKGVSIETTIAELAPYLRGWRSYFGFCETPEVLVYLTRWVRLRLRAALWRQWKTPRRRRAAPLQLGVRPRLASNTAGSGRGPWYLARAKALSVGLSNAYFKSLGLPTLIEGC